MAAMAAILALRSFQGNPGHGHVIMSAPRPGTFGFPPTKRAVI
jgi:hypothetical protein